MSNTHIYPVNDSREHILDGLYCPCAPSSKQVNSVTLITHNSFDGREFVEAESCDHKWEWVGGHGTPYGATEPEQMCKKCGSVNLDD